jgi:folate-binding protein YgfZ
LTPVALPYLALARVSGPDSAAFLHAHLSADVAGLPDGGANFACYCSPRGQVYGLLLVCRIGQEFMLVGERSLLPAMLKRLRLFVLRARVVLEAWEESTVHGCVAGSAASENGVAVHPAGVDLVYRLSGGREEAAADCAGWKEQELRRNIVWLGPATSERFIPQMLGLDRIGAVSFRKGCYPGQEIIARARYLGTVKRQPLLLGLFQGAEFVPGEPLKIRDGEHWLDGTVVDSVSAHATSPAHEVLVFAVAPVPKGPVQSVEYAGRDYRCATI